MRQAGGSLPLQALKEQLAARLAQGDPESSSASTAQRVLEAVCAPPPSCSLGPLLGFLQRMLVGLLRRLLRRLLLRLLLRDWTPSGGTKNVPIPPPSAVRHGAVTRRVLFSTGLYARLRLAAAYRPHERGADRHRVRLGAGARAPSSPRRRAVGGLVSEDLWRPSAGLGVCRHECERVYRAELPRGELAERKIQLK